MALVARLLPRQLLHTEARIVRLQQRLRSPVLDREGEYCRLLECLWQPASLE